MGLKRSSQNYLINFYISYLLYNTGRESIAGITIKILPRKKNHRHLSFNLRHTVLNSDATLSRIWVKYTVWGAAGFIVYCKKRWVYKSKRCKEGGLKGQISRKVCHLSHKEAALGPNNKPVGPFFVKILRI